jgi:death-on-curing protein
VRYEDVWFLAVEDVDAAHAEVIVLHGGEPSTLNPGLVESATMAPRAGYYASLAELAAVYAHGIAKNHGYQDGNKRTAALVLLKFLGANGFDVEMGPEWVGYIVAVVEGTMSRDDLTRRIIELMGGDPAAIESPVTE